MDKKRLLLFAALAAIVVLLAIVFSKGQKRFNWNESYDQESKNPYGSYIINNLLKGYFPNHSFREFNDSIPDNFIDTPGPSNYVFIGEALYVDSVDVQGLLGFVEKGNTAFISSKTIPFDLMFYLYYDECNDFYWDEYLQFTDTIAHLNFNHPDLKAAQDFEFKYLYRNKVEGYDWKYIDRNYFCEGEFSLTALGQVNDSLVNFARVKYGDGQFYLHTIPLAFSNIQLLDTTGLEYANKIFSHLPKGDIYWDNYSRVSEAVGRRYNSRQNYNPDRRLATKSPLQYILEQPPLAWAWYLLLSMGLLFLLFRTKRKQRVIPVLEKNTNTSLEFISTIGRLYFIQNNHRKLALQKMILFKAFVRQRYGMLAKESDDTYKERLITKSEVNEALVHKIFLLDQNINNSSFVSENTLIDFHNLIDQFYKNCK